MELREVTYLAVALRVAAAVIVGGILGLERGMKNRPAGLRTYMLVCVGACVIMLTNQYIYQVFGSGDPVRMGAQVVSGIGFLGAGTIIVTRRNQIKGLTTAAGLWSAAGVGLAIGVGFYLGALVTTFVVVLAFTVVANLEFHVSAKRQRLFVYLELDSVDSVTGVIDIIKTKYGAIEIQVTPSRSGTAKNVGMEALIRVPRKHTVEERIQDLQNIDHVIFAILAT